MFLAFAPEMLDDWLRRANREAAAAASSADDGDGALTDPDDTVTRQGRVLARLYREMHTSAKDEFSAAQHVFPKQAMVLEMFLSRLLEQNVQAVLERLLLPGSTGMATLAAVAAQQQVPTQGGVAVNAAAAAQAGSGGASARPAGHSRTNSFMERASNLATSFAVASGASSATAGGASTGGGSAAGAATAASAGSAAASQQQQSAGLQRQQLRLLVEAYSKTQRLASNLEKSVKAIAPLDVVNMAEGLWPTFLGNYPEQELQWLAAACADEVSWGGDTV